jgi:hypothetical protein
MQRTRAGGIRLAATGVAVAAIVLAGCGSSKSKTASSATSSAPTTLALSISESGKTAKYSAPASIQGGLVTVKLTNNGKKLHGAQLIRITGRHTLAQAGAVLSSESHKIPNWIRLQGGVGGAPPGDTASATTNLPAGKYAIVDFTAEEGPPVFAAMTVTPGTAGTLPSTATTITAAAAGKDRYRWQIAGPLKAGANEIKFQSKGKNTLHHLVAVRITKDVPIAKLVKEMLSNGPPPSYIDPSAQDSTAVIDSGRALTTSLVLTKPGKYIFLCHLNDRDGGKPHFAEGLITTVNVR